LLAVCVIPLIPRDVYLRSLDPQLYTTEKSGSFKVRFKFWAKSFELIEQHWLTGIGVGDQTTIVNMVTDELAGRITPQGVKASAHNEFIWSMVEVGIFGWLLHWSFVVWIFSMAIRAGSRFYRLDPEGEKYYLCVAIQIMLIGVVLFGVQQEVFHIPLKGWWLNAAIATFLYSSTRQSHSAEEISSFDLVPAEAT
jgi:O-antigen ligase